MDEALRFLVIDDDASDLRILKWHLRDIEDRRIEVASETDSLRAIEMAGSERIDLIFLDSQFGDTPGVAMLRCIREAGFEGPIVMLSNVQDERLAVEALRHGAADYLAKRSLTTEHLNRAVTNALQTAELQQDLKNHRDSLERSNVDLLHRSHEIETFYHTLSHELKTPLTSVREFTAILLDGLAGELMPEQRDYLGIILEGCEQMRLFLDDILDASRLETGKLAVELSKCDLSKVVLRTVASISAQSRHEGVVLSSSGLADLPAVMGDEHRIAQVLNNLIGNALKYTQTGGRITIEAFTEGEGPDHVRVNVKDTGCGIEEENLAPIFDRLFQVRESDTSTHGGLGLGLPICKGIIDLHGGEISVASEPSIGSQFTFTIPCYQGEPHTSPSSPGDTL
ncbi:MAG: signal transduction histidine kinase [Planctomycetota bacterium]|jgi:signal transduction histidine kinase